MVEYWPAARIEELNEELFTTSSCLSKVELRNTFKAWNKYYTVEKAWVDIYNNGRKVKQVNIDINDIDGIDKLVSLPTDDE